MALGQRPGASARGQHQRGQRQRGQRDVFFGGGPSPWALGGALVGSLGPMALFATSSLNDGATLKPLGGSEGPGGELRHPPPGPEKKREQIFRLFFVRFGGVLGVVWGVPPGSPGFPGVASPEHLSTLGL